MTEPIIFPGGMRVIHYADGSWAAYVRLGDFADGDPDIIRAYIPDYNENDWHAWYNSQGEWTRAAENFPTEASARQWCDAMHEEPAAAGGGEIRSRAAVRRRYFPAEAARQAEAQQEAEGGTEAGRELVDNLRERLAAPGGEEGRP